MNLSNIAQSTAGEHSGFELPTPGVYKGYIESAEVKVGASSGNKYIALRISLTDNDGKKYGSIFPNFFCNDKNYCQYQLKCLCEATDVLMDGEVEEEELATLVDKHEVFVAVTIEKGTNGYKDKAVLDWRGFEKPIDIIDRYYEAESVTDDTPNPWETIESTDVDELPLPLRG